MNICHLCQLLKKFLDCNFPLNIHIQIVFLPNCKAGFEKIKFSSMHAFQIMALREWGLGQLGTIPA